MQLTVVVFLLSYIGFASFAPINPPIPVTDTEHGLRRAPVEPRPSVQFEFFADMTCPDSEQAWPIALQVQAYYGASRLDLVLQQIPVPYHRNGFLATQLPALMGSASLVELAFAEALNACRQGFYVIQQWVPAGIWDYVDAVHANSVAFSTAATANKTETQVLDELADIAVASTGIDKNLFINDVPNHRTFTATAYKYAIKRGGASTPTYFVNGVDVVVGQDYVPTFDEWVAFFDPIMNSS